MALRLQAQLKGERKSGTLVDAAVAPVKGRPEQRSVKTEERFTPRGLPLRFLAHFRGDWGDIVVITVETELLRVGLHVNCHIELRLPTDEILEVAVINY